MLADFRQRIHPRGFLFAAIERTYLTTGALVAALVFVLILFFGIYMRLG